MNELDFALETKSIDEEGHIEGLAAGYGNVDYGGEVMLRGSISRSIKGKSRIPMLMYHDHKRPAGVWNQFEETDDGLLVKGRFSMKTAEGKNAYEQVKDGSLAGLSVGMVNVKSRFVGKARHITEASLIEVSLVTIPMNERTQVMTVKDLTTAGELPTVRQFEEFLREAGGFSKSLAAAIASKAYPLLNRGEPDTADELADFAKQIRDALLS